MADTTIHLVRREGPNSHAVCGKVFMSERAQATRMTFSVRNTTCPDCKAGIPAVYR